jgi:hypothetical protein
VAAIGDETSKVGVYNLHSGKRERFTKLEPSSEGGDPAEIDTNSYVRRRNHGGLSSDDFPVATRQLLRRRGDEPHRVPEEARTAFGTRG